tara:strand:+ start:143 stop:643 length:501 start_codon:yes stop_codon:yes gene_type:complete
VGERKCAFEGCNALEFRTSGYCLRHKGGLPDEKIHLIARKPQETGKKGIFDIIGRTEIWWIPIIPLLTFPLFAFDAWYIEQTDGYDADPSFLYDLVYYLSLPFVILILFSPILLPIYAVYLVRINRQRIENGEWNLFLAMFHILSFTAPLLVLLVLWVLASALGGA